MLVQQQIDTSSVQMLIVDLIYLCSKIEGSDALQTNMSFVWMPLFFGKIELHNSVQLVDSQSGFSAINKSVVLMEYLWGGVELVDAKF